MKYLIWISLGWVLLAMCTVSNPVWWIVLALGIFANGWVCAANEWKMPVRGIHVEGPRHTPMTQFTQYKLLADIIPTGFGKASIGDFLIWIGFLGSWAHRDGITYLAEVALCAYLLWVFGWSKGFRLAEKWDRKAIVDSKKNVPIVLMLMIAGNLLGVHGCSAKEMTASVGDLHLPDMRTRDVSVKTLTETSRSLGQIIEPPHDLLRRLRERTEMESRQVVEDLFQQPFPLSQMTLKTNVDGSFEFVAKSAPKKLRSGPFCRMTCSAHHGGVYDVETLPEACRANWIPPKTQWVPGWLAISDTEEIANPWPGPAQAGFESYKLYWSDLQSAATVVHKASESQ